MARIALVTGGTRGIGAATAVRLAHDGFDVAVNYLSRKEGALRTVQAIEATGRKAIAVQADVSDPADARRMVSETVMGLGRLDVLAEPVQQGRTLQLWLVTLTRAEDGKTVARGQVRLQNVPLPGA